MLVKRRVLRVVSSGAAVSLAATFAAWVSLLVRLLGAPWAFVLVFLLLGGTGCVVGVAAAAIERTALSFLALAAGLAAPVAFFVWLSTVSSDAFS